MMGINLPQETHCSPTVPRLVDHVLSHYELSRLTAHTQPSRTSVVKVTAVEYISQPLSVKSAKILAEFQRGAAVTIEWVEYFDLVKLPGGKSAIMKYKPSF